MIGVVLLSCRLNEDSGERKVTSMASGTHPEVRLQYDLRVSADNVLALRYSVHNDLNRDIFLFTPLADFRDQEFVPVPRRVYVFVEDETVHITKRLWPVPDDVEVYMPEVPYLTRVAAGTKWDEQLNVPLPLIENYPYQFLTNPPDHDASPRTWSGTRAMFSIGYLLSDPENDVIPEPEGALYTISYGIGKTSQQLMIGAPVEVSVDVRRVGPAKSN